VITETIKPRAHWSQCIVVATGPSLTEAVAARVRAHQHTGTRVVAVNDAYTLLPEADVLYAGDGDWWNVHRGCVDFAGEKWSSHGQGNDKTQVAAYYGLRLVAGPRQFDAPGFSLDGRCIHYGNTSGFQAINLAILFGATEISLVGFDMRVPTGQPRHFFGDHPEPLGNVCDYGHFLFAFNAAAKMLPKTIRIVNCTPGSALRCFPMGELEELARV